MHGPSHASLTITWIDVVGISAIIGETFLAFVFTKPKLDTRVRIGKFEVRAPKG